VKQLRVSPELSLPIGIANQKAVEGKLKRGELRQALAIYRGEA